MAFKCFDDPSAIFDKDLCVSPVSKNIRGDLKLKDRKDRSCKKPECKTLRTSHYLTVDVGNTRCDSPPARPLAGTLTAKIMTAFQQDGEHRGFHSGDFEWVGSTGVKVTGRMSGVTNVGSHRLPIKDCQKCGDKGIMEGKLCGEVVDPANTDLKGCQVVAAYRIKFDPSLGAISTAVVGTIEGVLVCFCTA